MGKVKQQREQLVRPFASWPSRDTLRVLQAHDECPPARPIFTESGISSEKKKKKETASFVSAPITGNAKVCWGSKQRVLGGHHSPLVNTEKNPQFLWRFR